MIGRTILSLTLALFCIPAFTQQTEIKFLSGTNAANTVSVGNKKLKRRIVNVAKGKKPNDAVKLVQVTAARKSAPIIIRRIASLTIG